jgi:AcrR family transcriptional regulator
MLMFFGRGYGSTSMNAIAAAAGISAPSIYHYFPAKTDLLFECLYLPMCRQVDLCRQAIADKPPPAAVGAFVRTIILYLLDLPVAQALHGDTSVSMGVLAKFLPDRQRQTLQALIQDHIHDLRDLIVAGKATGQFRNVDATAAAFAVMALAENVTWFRPGGRLAKEELADLYAELAVDMLRPRPAE